MGTGKKKTDADLLVSCCQSIHMVNEYIGLKISEIRLLPLKVYPFLLQTKESNLIVQHSFIGSRSLSEKSSLFIKRESNIFGSAY